MNVNFSYKIFIIFLFANISKGYSQNLFDCNIWSKNPCPSPVNCSLASAKLYNLFPTQSSSHVEYDFPIESGNNCPGNNNRILKLTPQVLVPKTCVTHLIDGYRRFCYEPNSTEYASLFIHFNVNQFLKNIESVTGVYTGVLIINPVDKNITSVSVEPSTIMGNANIRYGVDNGFNFGTDLFYVIMGAAQGYLTQFNWKTNHLISGIGQYMAQSYIDSQNGKGVMFGSSDLGVILNKKCNEFPLDQVIATLLYKIESDPSYGIGREKLHRILNLSFKEFDFQSSNINSPNIFARDFFFLVNQISLNYPSEIKIFDICNIKNVITEYFTPNCTNPDLFKKVDYYIADDEFDDGTQPNASNHSEWESSAIINRNMPDEGTENEEVKAGKENTLYIEVKKLGCDTVSDVRLEVYFSLPQSGLSWDEAWKQKYINIGTNNVLVGNKIADIKIDDNFINNKLRIPISWMAPSIKDFNIEKGAIHILARIVSEKDKMNAAEVEDLRINVRENNNISWKVLTINE